MSACLDSDEVKLLIHRATRSAMARFGPLDETGRDYWDMWQEASIAVWKALEADKPDAYAFAAGRYAAIEWQRAWRGMKDHRTGSPTPPTFYAKRLWAETDDCAIQENSGAAWELTDPMVERLFELLINTRRAKGKKEIDGAVRATHIARLIVAGYNNVGICQETGLTYYNVRNYRRQLRITLEALLDAQGAA